VCESLHYGVSTARAPALGVGDNGETTGHDTYPQEFLQQVRWGGIHSTPSALVFPHLGFRLTQRYLTNGASEVQPRPARQISRTKVP